MKEHNRPEGLSSRRWWPWVIGAASVSLLAAWLGFPASTRAPELTRSVRAVSSAPKLDRAPAPRAAPVAPHVAIHRNAEPAPAEQQNADEGDDAVPEYNPNATEEGHPHPITEQHQRIFRENDLIGQLNGAMDVGDFIAMRRFNAEYRKDYPEDDNRLQEGYDLIADCLEQRSSDSEARARRFWKKQRASTLRRYVRRYCLSEP